MPDTPVQATDSPSIDQWKKLLIVVLLGSAGIFMVSISWLKWPNLLIDFGEQVYVPWQLSQGKMLYRDIVYLYGSFSSYMHAFLFRVFGESIVVLALFNILVVSVLTWLIYDLFLQLSDQLTATVCSLAFILLFAFGQYGSSGNLILYPPTLMICHMELR